MKTSAIALLVAVMLAAPVAAHQRGFTMLKDAAVNHDLEKAKRQFDNLVKIDDVSTRAIKHR
jgi:multisubunit Na+/H+ antiporter MnhG subunit